MKNRRPYQIFFAHTFPYLLITSAMAMGYYFTVSSLVTDQGHLWGYTTREWAYLFGLGCFLQHFLGWLVFRLQIAYQGLTRLFGRFDLVIWGLIFYPLLLFRPIVTLLLAKMDWGSLYTPSPLTHFLGGIIILPALYTIYSVVRYFGVVRALGADHFREKYRTIPLEKRGIYKYSDNAMYTYFFFFFWGIGIISGSVAVLITALFQHAFIWVHMYTTEGPDMDILYGKKEKSD